MLKFLRVYVNDRQCGSKAEVNNTVAAPPYDVKGDNTRMSPIFKQASYLLLLWNYLYIALVLFQKHYSRTFGKGWKKETK